MKTKKKYIAVAVVLLSSFILFSACKQHTNRTGFIFDYISESLDLTKEQQKKLGVIRDEIMAKVDLMHEDKKEMHALLKEQLASETIDRDVIRQLVTDHRTKMDTIVELAIEKLADFHGELSPEQRTKLIAKIEKWEKHHCQRYSK